MLTSGRDRVSASQRRSNDTRVILVGVQLVLGSLNWTKPLGLGDLTAAPHDLRSALSPSLVRSPDLLCQGLVAVKGGVLVDRHRCLRSVAGAGLEFGGGGAVLAG